MLIVDLQKEFGNIQHTSSWTANNSISVVPSPPGCAPRATVPLTDKPPLPVEAVPSLVLSPPLLASLVLDVVETASISNSMAGGAKVAVVLFSDSPPLLVLEAIELASLSLWAISHSEAFNLQESENKLTEALWYLSHGYPLETCFHWFPVCTAHMSIWEVVMHDLSNGMSSTDTLNCILLFHLFNKIKSRQNWLRKEISMN